MSSQNTLEIQDCVVEDSDSTVYRALYNGKPRHVRIWKQIPDDHELQRLQYVYAVEEDFPQPYHLLNINEQCCLLLQSINGLSITTLQSSLSPKVVYEIVAKACQALHQSHMTLSSPQGIILSPQGNLFIYTPCLPKVSSSIDSIWQLGWWALRRLTPTDGSTAHTLMLQRNETEYNNYLKQTLRNLESGLPNQQWIASVLQSFEYMCAFHPTDRWNAETSSKMMRAYAEQAIGLSLSRFCSQHTRLFDGIQYTKGSLSGQVHPCTMWKVPNRTTHITTTLQTHLPSEIKQYFLITATTVFLGLHSITATGMWIASNKTQAPIEATAQVHIEHSGIRKLTLGSGLTDGVKIVLSRSKRTSETTIPKGRYKLTIKHMNALRSKFIDIDSKTHIVCEHDGSVVECTQNNRTIDLK